MNTVPFSLAAANTRFAIDFGASTSTSTNLAPDSIARQSLFSAIWDALMVRLCTVSSGSRSEGSDSIISDTRQVATSGTSEVKHSPISSSDKGHLSNLISAISQDSSASRTCSKLLFCIVVQIIIHINIVRSVSSQAISCRFKPAPSFHIHRLPRNP